MAHYGLDVATCKVVSPLPQLGLGDGGRPSKHAVNTSMYARRRLAALRNSGILVFSGCLTTENTDQHRKSTLMLIINFEHRPMVRIEPMAVQHFSVFRVFRG